MSAPAAEQLPSPAQESSPLALACARLERSRAGLRSVLTRPPEASAPARSALAGGLARAWKRQIEELLGRLREQPVTRVLLESIGEWWRQHPWRDCVELAGFELRERVLPVLRRNARGTLLAAFAGGALLMLLRPWRWSLLHRGLSPLPSRFSRWVLAELSSLPLQSILVSIMLMASERRQGAEAAPESAAPSGAVGDV